MTEIIWAYAAFKACGCMVAATVDRPELRKATARGIAQWIRRGLTVERVDVERVRKELLRCPHGEKKAVRA